MEQLIKYKILTLPAIIWGLQILYVVLALGLFIILLAKSNRIASYWLFQVLYVLAMLVVDIIWRVAIRNLKPEWF